MDKKLEIHVKKYRCDTMGVSARLPSDLVARIDSIAEQSGKNRNEIVQLCLEFAIENIELKD